MVRAFLLAHANLLGELAAVLMAFAAVILVLGTVIARFDRIPLGQAIYLAFITAFTVGFGDIVPRSPAAKVATVVLAFLGVLLVGIAVAVAVHALDIALATRAE